MLLRVARAPNGDHGRLLVRFERVPEVTVVVVVVVVSELNGRNVRADLAFAGQGLGTGDGASPEDASQVLQGVEAAALLRLCWNGGGDRRVLDNLQMLLH